MKIIDGIPVFGEPQENALSQMRTVARTAHKTALMADHHKGYSVPIGGVVAYKDAISPSGVGYDIGCGNKAVRLEGVSGETARAHISEIMDRVFKEISFGVGRSNAERVEHEIFDYHIGWKLEATRNLKDLARNQLGTVGSGNHYVDVFVDELDRVWVGVHFGSRGLGHRIATYFLEAAGAQDGMDVEPCVLDTRSDLGSQYLVGMALAGAYAYAGRDWVCSRVADIIGGHIVEVVHNHHNFAWRETHGTEDLWVVRKGATPAFPGQTGFIGGSMAESAYIVAGARLNGTPSGSGQASIGSSQLHGTSELPLHGGHGSDAHGPNEASVSSYSPNDSQSLSLFSTVHGAGRVMGRREAIGKVDKKSGVVTREGKVTTDMLLGWLNRSGIQLRGAGLDESPDCYKRLDEVLAAHEGTLDILHELRPIGVAMAGPDIRDPYKD